MGHNWIQLEQPPTVNSRGGSLPGCLRRIVSRQSSNRSSTSLPPPRVGTPGGCQIGYMCDQNSTYGLHSLPGCVRLVTCATRTRLMGRHHCLAVINWGLLYTGRLGLPLPGGVRLVTWTVAVINLAFLTAK
jgi:hypothetical protein